MNKNKFTRCVFAGGVSSIIATIATHPMDLIQTRLSSSIEFQVFRNINTLKTFKQASNILRLEGIRGLWRGLMPCLVGVIPSKAIFFGCYEYTRSYLITKQKKINPVLIEILASAVGVVVNTTIVNPMFVLKTRMQIQEAGKILYRGYWDCCKQIYMNEGIFAFSRGLTASWLGISETAIYFIMYQYLKRCFKDPKHKNLSILGISCFCKLSTNFVTYPHEVLRTRLREYKNNKKMRNICKDMYKNEGGLRSFYSGLTAHLFRVVPKTMIMFFVYEYLCRLKKQQ